MRPSFLSSITTFCAAVVGSSYLFQPETWWLFRLSSQETSDTKYMNCSDVLLLACAKKLQFSGLNPLRAR